MPHSYGKRARTRNLFSQPFRRHGPVSLSKYLTTFKVGEFVDIKGNGSIHKGMPYKFYHGRTGRIWNVSPTSVGVVINKQVRNRIIPKRIHVRIEHVKKSRCQEDLKFRMSQTLEAAKFKKENPTGKKEFHTRRSPAAPRKAFVLKMKHKKLEHVEPIPYEIKA